MKFKPHPEIPPNSKWFFRLPVDFCDAKAGTWAFAPSLYQDNRYWSHDSDFPWPLLGTNDEYKDLISKVAAEEWRDEANSRCRATGNNPDLWDPADTGVDSDGYFDALHVADQWRAWGRGEWKGGQ